LEDSNIYETSRSVYDCITTSKNIDNLACADTYYFQVRTVSIYQVLGSPSRPLAGVLSSYCDSFRVRGSLNYVNYDEKYAEYSYDADTIPLVNSLVTIWEYGGDSLPIPALYTNTFGGLIDTLLYYHIDNPIYMRFQLVDQSESLKVKDYDNDAVIFTYSDTLGPDNFFKVIRDEFLPSEQDRRFARASYSFDYIQKTKKRFEVKASWITPPILVAYDYNNLTDLSFSWYDSLWQDYWVVLTSFVDEPFFGYRLGTPAHEFAHLIHINAWEVNSLGSGCPPIHALDTPTSGYCALVEGWAEFISCIFRGDKAKYLKLNQQDLENNDWWAGTDGTNENGSFVEGAVASAWYDMEDWDADEPDEFCDTVYYELSGEFDKIFNIFRTLKPQDMVEFMTYWQNDPNIEAWEKEHMVKIFSQHYIFKPGDANTDGNVSMADIVFLVNYLFKQGAAPDPLWVGDANGDCNVSVADTVYLISYLFKQGAEPIYNPDC
jgi:hypothetical protein